MLHPVVFATPNHNEMLRLCEAQRPSALARPDTLTEEFVFDLTATIMTSRVETGVDARHAETWGRRCALLDRQLRAAGYVAYEFPSPKRLKTEVRARLAAKHGEEMKWIFVVNDVARVALQRIPGLGDFVDCPEALHQRLLNAGGALSTYAGVLAKTDGQLLTQVIVEKLKRSSD